MKNQTPAKKLALKKETLQSLTSTSMISAKGGSYTQTFCNQTIDNTISTIDKSNVASCSPESNDYFCPAKP